MKILSRLNELWSDPKDDTLSHTRLGMIIAGASMTYKMLTDLPDDPMLWLTYLGCVGGYGVARQMAAKRNGSQNNDQNPPSA